MARTYLLDAAVILVPTLLVLSIILLVVGTLTRIFTLYELRSLVPESQLPFAVRSRPAFIFLLVLQLALPIVSLLFASSPWLVVTAWIVSTLVSALLAGFIASHVAAVLDHKTVFHQLRAQRAVLFGAAFTSLLCVVLLLFFPPVVVLQLHAFLLAFLALIALGHTGVALTTLSRFLSELPPHGNPNDHQRVA